MKNLSISSIDKWEKVYYILLHQNNIVYGDNSYE
jgi:hypothetical protein